MISNLEPSERRKLLKGFQTDPYSHVVKIQGVKTLEPYQKRILETVAKHERVVISACHDVGKTFTLAKVVLWFGSIFPGSKIITTAPTFNQVKRLLWSEIRDGFVRARFPLGGEMLSTEWKIREDWFAVGFTSRNEATQGEGQGGASTFQGFHARYILVIFDEATGISASIWKQVEGLLTSGFVRFVAIANPTTKACEFYKCFSNPAYKKIKLSCFDSPNFPANGIHGMKELEREVNRLKELSEEQQYEALESYKLVNQYLLTVKWVVGMCLRYGFKHPLVVSKCFGQFPEEDEWTLISLGTVEEAQARYVEVGSNDQVSIGVDVARFGSDKTVMTLIEGCKHLETKVLVHRDTSFITGTLVEMISRMKSRRIRIVVDATGIGSGVVDQLKERRAEGIIPEYVSILECHFGGAPGPKNNPDKAKEESKKYSNLKAKIFILLADDLKKDLSLLPEEVYQTELPTIRYSFTSKGQWCIESKDEYRTRTGMSSPDHADSLALANYGRYPETGIGDFHEAGNEVTISTIIETNRGADQW